MLGTSNQVSTPTFPIGASTVTSEEAPDTNKHRGKPLAVPTAMPTFADVPLAWLLTFSTYGSRLHGDERGSRDRLHNVPGTPGIPPNEGLKQHRANLMKATEVALSPAARTVVTKAIMEVCRFRGWPLHAVNVRSQHAHAVASGDRPPERMLVDLKAYATRALIAAGLAAPHAKVWTRYGSARGLYSEMAVVNATRYVLERQGEGRGQTESDDGSRELG